jgi:hypothetical protein
MNLEGAEVAATTALGKKYSLHTRKQGWQKLFSKRISMNSKHMRQSVFTQRENAAN